MSFLEEIKQKELEFIKIIGNNQSIFSTVEEVADISEVIAYDFSKANMSEKSRLEAVTLVASTCYANPNAIGREALFDRLKQESLGLPSSSFEFIPVLLSTKMTGHLLDLYSDILNTKNIPDILLFGEEVKDEESGKTYWLTNYRALCNYYELVRSLGNHCQDFRGIYNTSEEELKVIAKHFKVFLSYIDTNTRTQYIRHRRAAWQELSRRYVSGKKLDFAFYTSEKMYNVTSTLGRNKITTQKLFDICVEHYNEAIRQGVQPQEARRCLPQAMYTTIWSAWMPGGLQNFFDLRLDKHAQYEIRKLAEAKYELIGESNDNK